MVLLFRLRVVVSALCRGLGGAALLYPQEKDHGPLAHQYPAEPYADFGHRALDAVYLLRFAFQIMKRIGAPCFKVNLLIPGGVSALSFRAPCLGGGQFWPLHTYASD